MSRFVQFNRPPSFQFPAPPSPPETELITEPRPDRQLPSHFNRGNPYGDLFYSSRVPCRPLAEGLHSCLSPVGLARQQTYPKEPRPIKWLVVVLPPKSLNREPTMLGHTLSTGPSGRFSNGIIMPLFPTLYSQLTAIAREFNMPSTTGVCLYMHIPQGPGVMTPRISDDTWPLLWAHLLDDSFTPPSTLTSTPVGGTIEFDIDPRKARWFDMWKGVSRMSNPDSEGVLRKLSLSTSQTLDEILEPPKEPPATIRPRISPQAARRVPRPLSLVDRNSDQFEVVRDGPSVRVPQDAFDGPAPPMLSPVPQSAAPPAVQGRDLMNRVTNWRDVTSISPAVHPLVTSGQFSLDPTNMPNSAPQSPVLLPSVSAGVQSPESMPNVPYELDLNDFQWSISSVGPQSAIFEETPWPSPIQSVHLARRLEGSVCLTASVATSFGPDDSEYGDDSFSYCDRLPSPDLGQRALSDAPVTPSTATTWGPASWIALESPDQSEFELCSLDIAYRGRWSQPNTPSTATTWGAPEMYPPSPAAYSPIRTPDIGERTFRQSRGTLNQPDHLLSFPYYSAWTVAPWRHVWPYTQFPGTSLAPVRAPPMAVPPPHNAKTHSDLLSARKNNHTSPYHSSRKELPWPLVWPYISSSDRHNLDASERTEEWPLPGTLAVSYPFFSIYPSVYPYLDIYPGIGGKMECVKNGPCADLTPESARPAFSSLSSQYPVITPYPPVYPFIEVYPSCRLLDVLAHLEPVDLQPGTHPSPGPNVALASAGYTARPTLLLPTYPNITVYPPVYPHLEIYPPVKGDLDEHRFSGQKAHPDTVVYPPQYVCSPTLVQDNGAEVGGIDVLLPSHYPHLEPYRGVYPHIEPYPAVHWYPSTDPNSALEVADTPSLLLDISLKPTYPNLQPYHPTYPFLEIYPATHLIKSPDLRPIQRFSYPYIIIYPAVYPFVEPYPQADLSRRKTHRELHRIVMSQMALEQDPPKTRMDSPRTLWNKVKESTKSDAFSGGSTIRRGVAERAKALAERVEKMHQPTIRLKVSKLDRTKLPSILQ